MTALQALEKLRQGNAHFINNVRGTERSGGAACR